MHAETSGSYTRQFVDYGIRTPTADVAHMVKIHHVVEKLTQLLQPGTLPPVDIFPFMHWVPERFWGNWFTKVMELKKETDELYSEYLDIIVRRRKKEGSRDSFADRLLDQQEKLGGNWHQQCFMAGMLMDAGSDTTAAAINTFI